MLHVCRCIGLLVFALLVAPNPMTGAVRLQVIQGRPVVDGVYVNGHGPYRFLVDTATSLNHMEPRLAHSIGLVATYRTQLTSSLGTVVVEGSDSAEVMVGAAHAEGTKVSFL